MTNNIGGIYGYGYGTNIYGTGSGNKGVTGKEGDDPKATEQPAQPQINVDPNEVLNFLASSSITINTTPAVVPANDAATAERVEGYVQNFEMVYSIIAQEFGDDVANLLMNDDAFIEALMAQG